MRILLIDNNMDPKCWGARDLLRPIQQAAPAAEVHIRRGPQMDYPAHLETFDYFVLSGSLARVDDQSDWLTKQEGFIQGAFDRSRPMLGVCFGHQLIVRALGGMDYVRRSETPEFGWTEVRVDSDTGIMKGLGPKFHSFESHHDEVSSLPQGFSCTASSDKCGQQAFEVSGKPMFGIQFHPEKTPEEGLETYAEVSKSHPEIEFENPEVGKVSAKTKAIYNPELGKKIFENFFGHEHT